MANVERGVVVHTGSDALAAEEKRSTRCGQGSPLSPIHLQLAREREQLCFSINIIATAGSLHAIEMLRAWELRRDVLQPYRSVPCRMSQWL